MSDRLGYIRKGEKKEREEEDCGSIFSSSPSHRYRLFFPSQLFEALHSYERKKEKGAAAACYYSRLPEKSHRQSISYSSRAEHLAGRERVSQPTRTRSLHSISSNREVRDKIGSLPALVVVHIHSYCLVVAPSSW